MNKKGFIPLMILISIVYFVFGMMIYQFLKPDITTSRTDLECTAPDTAGDMLTCLIIDGVVPMFVIIIISGAGGYITNKILT